MAKKAAAPRTDRSGTLKELNEVVEFLADRVSEFDEQTDQRALLESVAHGLYEETDKLTKKAPSEQATELLLDQVNQVIGETKELITGDPYVQRLKQFVPAGDRPELRDVVVILRMVLQALTRFAATLAKDKPEAQNSLSEARVLLHATAQWEADGEVISKAQLRDAFVKHAQGWFDPVTEAFDFAELDSTDLKEYFGIE